MSSSVLHVFPSFATGGVQVRTLRLLEGLGASYRHELLALDGRLDALELPLTGEVRSRIETLEALPRSGSLRTSRWLRQLVAERAPDLVCTYNWGAIDTIIGLRALGPRGSHASRGPGILHHEEGFGPDETEHRRWHRSWARRALLPHVEGVIVPSERLRQIALEEWRQAPDHVHLIPNGIQVRAGPERGSGPDLRRELGIDQGAHLIGTVGPLRAEKNPVRLVEVLSRTAADTELLIVGDGPERTAVERTAERLGVSERVHLAGHRSDPAPFYRALDAFLLTSDTEQMPMALLEAMASGLPVLSVDVGDVKRVLPPAQRAFVVAPDASAPTRLGELVARLREEPATARRLGEENRAHVAEHYPLERMVERYRALYELAIS